MSKSKTIIETFKNYLYEPKSSIGWVYGILACTCALICAYLNMMLFSALMPGDYVQKIIPSVILTPILISAYGLWLLFSNSTIILIKKTAYCSLFFIILITISIKAF